MLLHRELDGVGGGFGAQVVHARFQALLPAVEVHARELAEVHVQHVQVQALALADERAPVGRHIDDAALGNLPHRFIQVLDVLRDARNVLHRAVGGNDGRLHLLVPEAELDEVLEQVLVHHHELAAEHPAHVNVARVGLKRLVVAQNLGGAGRGHGGHQQRVARAVLHYLRPQRVPVPAARVGRNAPEVELELALAQGRAGEGFVGPVALGQVLGGRHGREVERLEDVLVQAAGFVALEGHAQGNERIGQPLHAQPDGAVAAVAALGLGHGVVVDVDDLVEVQRGVVGYLVELLVVEEQVTGLVGAHVAGEGQRGEVADRNFVLVGVLHNLGAEVGALDGAQVLLVALAVGGVLEQHVGRAGLGLAFQNGEPQLLGLDGFAALAFALVLEVELLELGAVAGVEARALVGAHQRPVAVGFHALHEQVGRPEGEKQVAGAHLFLAVVLFQIQEVEDVGVPGLQVNGESALALAAPLVHVAGRVVEHLEHGHEAVGGTVGAFDVGAGGAHVVHGQPDAAGALRNQGAVLQRVVNAVDGVVLHREQKAGAELGLGRAGVEERGRGVGEPPLAHQLVGFDGGGNVFLVNAHGHAHQHVLGPLDHLAIKAQQVAALQRFKAEVVVVVVAVVNNGRVEGGGVLVHDFPHVLGHERGVFARLGVLVGVQPLHGAAERLAGHLVQVAHGNAGGQDGVVGVLGGERGGRFGGQVVELDGRHAIVNAVNHLLGHLNRRHEVHVQAVAKLLDAGRNLVELHRFAAAVALEYQHKRTG